MKYRRLLAAAALVYLAAPDRAACQDLPKAEPSAATDAPTYEVPLPPITVPLLDSTDRAALGSGSITRAPTAPEPDSVTAYRRMPRSWTALPPSTRADHATLRPMGVAKWSVLASTATAAVYGVAASMAADDHYTRIERLCADDATRCEKNEGNGRYLDPEVDRLDRRAEKLDRTARIGLLASQIGAAASVVLFILDLRDTGAPPNVPYTPSGLRLSLSATGLQLTVSTAVP